jgi:membrane protein DedA with SNARE-associated domain
MELTPLVRLAHLVLPYAGLTIAAIVEGELAYIGAAVLVAHGQLNPVGVVLSGALGAAVGDQAYFYVFRGRLPRWLARYPSLQQKAAPLVDRVRRHHTLMVLLIRFAPGLRIAIAAACAWVDIPPLKFSVLNLLSALVWAVGLLVVVGRLGPTYLAQYGLGGWKGALVIGLAVFGVLKVFGWYGRRAVARGEPPYAGQQPRANP